MQQHISPFTTDRSGHASEADRVAYREQLAILLRRDPALAAPLLDELYPIERAFVEGAARVQALLEAADAPRD